MKIELSYFVKKLLYLLPDPVNFRLRFFWKHWYWPDINNPRSLTEKLLWLMIWDENPLRSLVADRIKVREFVQEHAPSCKLPKHLWTGESLTSAIWNDLPQKFVLKANHGSHMIHFVDKRNDTFDDVVKMSKIWLNKDYSLDFGEWVYKDLPRVLIAEEKLDIEGKIPPDWKFLCANGKVLYTSLIMDRGQTTGCENFYLPDFSRLLDMSTIFPPGPDIDEPTCFKDAVRIAEQLSAHFDFIRVDLYLIGEAIYFGEMTCYPGAALVSFNPVSYDFEFGSRINLDNSFVNSVPRSIWANQVKSSV
jgi:TupA-like ATPgrasp